MNKEITYSKYTASDIEIFKTLVYDDEIMKYISGKALTEKEAEAKFSAILKVNNREDKLGYFKVCTIMGEFIGDCKLECYKHDSSILEIGYILKKAYQGLGYGTQICKDLLAISQAYFPKQDIIGIIDPENIASKKLLTKFDFKSYFVGVEDALPTEKLILRR